MVRGGEGRLEDGEIERLARRRVPHERAQPGAALDASHVEPPIAHPAHHVEVEHGDRTLHGHRGMARVVGGAEEPHLLAREEREDQRARRRAGRREGPREPEDDGGAGRIVVGAGMDEAAGAPEVVVVSAQDHRLRRARRIGARQDADDVAGAPILALEVDADAGPDARGERRREPGVRQRSAELGAYQDGNWRAARTYRQALREVAQSLQLFIEREFIALLRQSKSWSNPPIYVAVRRPLTTVSGTHPGRARRA